MATAIDDHDDTTSITPTTGCPPNFSKYEKMNESTVKLVGPEIHQIKQWVIMEKIHGANLSLTIYNKERHSVGVKIGRRNDYLKEGERFYSLETQSELQSQLHESCLKLWKGMTPEERPQAIIIYGELFGGYYPHPSVSPIPGVISVQKEVAYCSQLKFCAYDIALCTGSKKDYMDYDKAMDMFSSSGFMYSRPLAIGSYDEAINYPLGFATTLPSLFGLPPVENNLAEGVVIKPLKNSTILTHKGPTRVILKLKIPKFSERRALPRPEEHARLIQEEKKKCANKMMSTEAELLKYELAALVTETRLINTLSKTGLPSTKKEWNSVKEALAQDVLESLRDDNQELWDACKDDAIVMTILSNEAKKQCGILMSQHKKKLTEK